MTRILLLILACLAAPAQAAPVEVSSPEGALQGRPRPQRRGPARLRVSRLGRPVILADSRLGFILRDGRQLLRSLAAGAQATRSVDETWEQPWGERRFVRNHYNELRASFVESDRDQRRFDVVFRVFDDGVGFRYEFPKQPKLDEVQIQEELTEFAIARPATAWWIPAFEWNREEYLYHRTPLAEVGRGADADHAAHRRRPARRLPRSGAGRLRRHEPGQGRRTAAARVADAGRGGGQGAAHGAVRHALAHDPDRRPRRRAGRVQPDPQPQRAQQARRRQLVQAVQVRRRVVVAAPGQGEPGAPARSTARPRRTPSATSTSPRSTASAACWWKAGTWAGTATGSPTAGISTSRKPTPDYDLEGAGRLREDARACT